ncbi:SEC-C domain-containing protein [Sphingomonas caeni]|uniref:SEC-C domain-containing protein n=1 Tax=Sphingomonas caeni TaxID=2984949 RepID=UPI00222FA0B6|nr:SEC-C domain-containing protein [Sphingomonas caeni]
MMELHGVLLKPAREEFQAALRGREAGLEVPNPLTRASALREAVFYSAESAFPFQYIELAEERYEKDRAWFATKKGFDIENAASVIRAATKIMYTRLVDRLRSLASLTPERRTFISLFSFTSEEISGDTGIDKDIVEKVLLAFSCPIDNRNTSFTSLSEFNNAVSYPIIRTPNGDFFLLLEYSASEALYDCPFYWMSDDTAYRDTALANRGDFSERSARRLLSRIFPSDKILSNIIFKSGKKKTDGEADALIIFGERAFVVQIKSKKLTQVARSGNSQAINRDFSSAVQSAYDQAITCINCLRSGTPIYSEGKRINLDDLKSIRKFYPICITSEHYPALLFQCAQFLRTLDEDYLSYPLVFDIFTLDVITEFLNTPLYFCDYLAKRARVAQGITASHELIILAFHLKRNLWIENDAFVSLPDEFLVELDLAMAVRRRGLKGASTPKGLLTREKGTPFGEILDEVNKSSRPDVHQLGELLLSLGSSTCDALNRGLRRIRNSARRDGRSHDATMWFEEADCGLTIHCNSLPEQEAYDKLRTHCEMRKYTMHANRWFGICLGPKDGRIRFGLGIAAEWQLVPELEEEAINLRIRSAGHLRLDDRRSEKVGPNQQCPCGSGRKFKHCHARRLQ